MNKFVLEGKPDPDSYDPKTFRPYDDKEDFDFLPSLNVVESNNAGKLNLSVGDKTKDLNVHEAKALAKYLNSWAGFAEASNKFSDIDYVYPINQIPANR